ncbi:hypothetical protein [Sporosarcina highlanderae]|uniref:DUF4025 domain-containing protein n=1 Tax=Sporosarcina highlanderae TaxID=3035916 RepID=A0ABT8JTU9_9BACL|nr:hypothetical protein [Sporosarcina highlanderae]MDN4607817.1 hypothetical protein [Sporosarcina highlanderae]
MFKKDKSNGKNKDARAELAGTEYTDEQRHTNEVASTAYKGSKNEKVDIQNDRLESGGF